MEVHISDLSIPGKEMGSLELVTAFIKIGIGNLSIQQVMSWWKIGMTRPTSQAHFTHFSSKASRPKEAQRCTFYRAPLAGMLAVHVRHLPSMAARDPGT